MGRPSLEEIKQCETQYILAVKDALNVLSGKWKLPIIASLIKGNKRFKDLESNTNKISPSMLSKELKELELNGIIERQVHNTKPVLIEYHLTDSGYRLSGVLDAMVQWGLEHRRDNIKSE